VSSRRPGDPPRLVAVGRLLALKNQVTILRALAAARNGDIHLTLVGKGPTRAMLQREVQRLGIADRVTFTGEVSRDCAFQYMWQADGFISMSSGEGLPVAVLEAMACQCPVILSDIDPHRELAAEGAELVRLTGVHDVSQLASQLDQWASLSQIERWRWGAACRKCIEQSFTLPRFHQELDQLFAELVAGGSMPTVEADLLGRQPARGKEQGGLASDQFVSPPTHAAG
jgi:glycosyltransferase involved in cell wall biosynthesis